MGKETVLGIYNFVLFGIIISFSIYLIFVLSDKSKNCNKIKRKSSYNTIAGLSAGIIMIIFLMLIVVFNSNTCK
jgi:asparagine N-glycosylation enzyme membrane subunit Stt3